MNRLLEEGRGWVPCKVCGLPCIISESWSAYGGTISHGCADCLVKERNEARKLLQRVADEAGSDGDLPIAALEEVDVLLGRRTDSDPHKDGGR